MDPDLADLGTLLAPFVFAAIIAVFAWVESDLGVTNFGFSLIYKDHHPRIFWFLGEGELRLAVLGCFGWGVANLWRAFVVPSLGSCLAGFALWLLAASTAALLIVTDFRFGHVWLTFRLGWPSPVWRDRSPGWFWFWEYGQGAAFVLFLVYTVAALFK